MKHYLWLVIFMISSMTGISQNVVDVHCHNIFPFYMDMLDKHNAALDEGFPLPSWDVDSHLSFMDSAGISCSLLSMPAPQPYFGDSEECCSVIRKYNESCARLKSDYPGKFIFCASLPLPDVDGAVAEAVYALDTLGADGIKLATNSLGQYLGDSVLDPLMEVLNSRKAVIVIHPHKPVPVNDSLMEGLPLAAYEYLAETTRAVMNLVTHNVLVRFPNLKIVVPHCASFLPLAIPRIKALLPGMQARGLLTNVDIDGNLSRLYYDLAGAASPSVIRSMLTVTSPEHILYGSDYPYQSADLLVDNLRKLDKALAEDAELSPYREMFLWKNAVRLFSIQSDCTVHDESESKVSPVDENPDNGMLVRISEIEVYPEYLDEYLDMALEIGATSVREESGVIAIYPMIQKRDSCQVRILEIYADMDAYRHHISTAHFKKYKQGTLHMVKSLDLVDMVPMNPAAMPEIFLKMKGVRQ